MSTLEHDIRNFQDKPGTARPIGIMPSVRIRAPKPLPAPTPMIGLTLLTYTPDVRVKDTTPNVDMASFPKVIQGKVVRLSERRVPNVWLRVYRKFRYSDKQSSVQRYDEATASDIASEAIAYAVRTGNWTFNRMCRYAERKNGQAKQREAMALRPGMRYTYTVPAMPDTLDMRTTKPRYLKRNQSCECQTDPNTNEVTYFVTAKHNAKRFTTFEPLTDEQTLERNATLVRSFFSGYTRPDFSDLTESDRERDTKNYLQTEGRKIDKRIPAIVAMLADGHTRMDVCNALQIDKRRLSEMLDKLYSLVA